MIVGLTGGIGSGKTLVSSYFEALGVPVYISDIEAKKLMEIDKETVASIKKIFGEDSYSNQRLNRKFIASQVFTDKHKLNKLNAIVHPAVAKHFKTWYSKQKFDFVIKESAILFETGGEKQCDVIILVTAPLQTRISRVIQRDNTTEEEVKLRIKNQWDDEVKISRSDYVVTNIDKVATKNKVKELYQLLKARA